MSESGDASLHGRAEEGRSVVQGDNAGAEAEFASDAFAAATHDATPPRITATIATAAIFLSDNITTVAPLPSTSSSNSNAAAAAEEDALSTRRPPHRQFVCLRSFSLHLPDGELVDCKNTVQSHSLLNYSNDDGNDNNSSMLLATATVPSLSDDSLILPVDLEKSVTVPTDHSDDNGAAAVSSHDYDTKTFRTLECPVAIPLMNHSEDVATDALLSPLSSLPPPRIHYLMMEPTEAEDDRLLQQQQQLDDRANLSATTRWWQTPRFLQRWAISSFITILALVLLVARMGSTNSGNSTSGSFQGTSVTDLIAKSSSRRAAAIAQLINNATFSETNVTLIDSYFGSDSSSVEQTALKWLIHDDPLQLSPDNSSCKFRLVQRYALATFWLQLPPNHPMYHDFARNECNWSGIICETTLLGGSFDSVPVETVVEIKLRKWTGKLVPDVGLLSCLKHFDFTRSSLTGSLPHSIGEWTALVHFDASSYVWAGTRNQLTGSLPDSIGRWAVLEHFNVAENTLTGTLPKSIGGWTVLEYFNVGRNRCFNGYLPDTAWQWNSLKHFDVSNNCLSGPLPILPGKWMMIEFFVVSNNIYTGSLPELFGQWTGLVVFDVSENQHLTGTLPHSIEKWTDLYYFNVGSVDLRGPVPRSILSWPNVEYTYFINTNLTGSIPVELCSFNMSEISVDCDRVACPCGNDVCSCDDAWVGPDMPVTEYIILDDDEIGAEYMGDDEIVGDTNN